MMKCGDVSTQLCVSGKLSRSLCYRAAVCASVTEEDAARDALKGAAARRRLELVDGTYS